ncbi:MAG: PA2169 family four-helix-bundle protein [Chakrabartia sp.]
MHNDHDIRVLNSLVMTTIDSVNGYREAATNSSNEQFRSIFAARADEREEIVRDLQAHVRELGGTPEDDGSALAGAHRFMLDVRDALTGRDDQAVIAEVERGEDHIKRKYEAALEDTDVSPHVRDLVQRSFRSVKEGHDQMRDLKHGVSGTTRF